MAQLLFRKMTKTDLPAVTKIENDCQSHPWTLLQFLDGFNAGHHGWVACQDNAGREEVMGFAIVATVLDESMLLDFCVSPKFQQMGFGKRLMTFILERARAENIVQFVLEVRASNRPAIALYESFGFKKISARKDYYPAKIGREDGLVYFLSSF